MQWFDNKLLELKRIYRGTDHQFTKKSWDNFCHNKERTLTVIQSEHGRIFGGYSSKKWKVHHKHKDYDFFEEDE